MPSLCLPRLGHWVRACFTLIFVHSLAMTWTGPGSVRVWMFGLPLKPWDPHGAGAQQMVLRDQDRKPHGQRGQGPWQASCAATGSTWGILLAG